MEKRGLELLEIIKSGKCEVLGLGISNVPLCRWLAAHGADVTGRDLKSESEIAQADELKSLGIKLVTGEKYLDGMGGAGTVIFRAPGIRPDVPQIKNAVDAGAVLTSEMELFLALTPATVLAVTGSDGKTTSTTLTYLFINEMCKRVGGRRVYVGGNIGEPLLPKVEEMTDRDFAVVELSSFQLMTMKEKPEKMRSAITNLSPNHLNWHTDMDEYINSKKNVISPWFVTNAENAITSEIASETTGAERVLFSSVKRSYADIADGRNIAYAIYEIDGFIVADDGKTVSRMLDVSRIRLPGRHNVENFMTAIGLTFGKCTTDDYLAVADTFTGVEHRLELVREKDGVKYYNSSIDSSPSRTCAALSAIDRPPVVLCGGRDKHVPFAPMAAALIKTAVGVVLFGEAAGKIGDALTADPGFDPKKLPVYYVPAFDDAVKKAAEIAKPGQAVLLSPGCTSFDSFRNFEERGKKFKEIINKME